MKGIVMPRTRYRTLLAYFTAERGRATRLAHQLHVSEAIISMWANGSRRIPAERCRGIFLRTRVNLAGLRPDLFRRRKS